MKNWKTLDIVSGLFISVLLVSNIVSTKLVTFYKFTFDGGTFLFPLSYIFGDILTEVYGYSSARRVIWIGFVSALLMSVNIYIVGKVPPSPEWQFQDYYDIILGITPRIVLASLIGYLIGNFSNSFILAKMKVLTGGKFLFLRTISSTIVGEFLDSIFFVLIAFYGLYRGRVLIAIAISNYVFKTLVEIFFTPITYTVVNFLKKVEKVDWFDRKTNFNPFLFKNNSLPSNGEISEP